jgi:mycothiol synthase
VLRKLLRILRGSPQGSEQLRMRLDHATVPLAAPDVGSPYRLVPYTPDLKAEWAAFLSATDDFGLISVATLETEVLRHLIPGSASFVMLEDRIVAAAAACALAAHAPCSTLMYVLVHPDHRGRSLAAAVVGHALLASRKAGFPAMMLQTDDSRLPAIRSYLRMGFVPVESSEAVAGRWRTVMERIDAAAVR